MLRRGWRITACDISPEMVVRARAKKPRAEDIEVCDMRELPVYGSFQLVWALNDPFNYLLDEGDLQLAPPGDGRQPRTRGAPGFRLRHASPLRECFAGPNEMGGDRWTWHGFGADGPFWEAELSGQGVKTHRHRERHHSVPEVRAAMLESGLVPVAAMGQREDDGTLVISDNWGEERDQKTLHVARRC
jgi:hypothetical protein